MKSIKESRLQGVPSNSDLITAVCIAQNQLRDWDEETVGNIWQEIELISNAWKMEYGRIFKAGISDQDFNNLRPWECSAWGANCYLDFIRYDLQKYPRFSELSNRVGMRAIYATVVLAEAEENVNCSLNAALHLLLEKQNEKFKENTDSVVAKIRKESEKSLERHKKINEQMKAMGEAAVQRVESIKESWTEWWEHRFKPTLALGTKVRLGAKQGHIELYGTVEEKQERWNNYQTHIDNLHRKRPNLSYEDLCRLASKEFNCSPKTIKRHTENPKK